MCTYQSPHTSRVADSYERESRVPNTRTALRAVLYALSCKGTCMCVWGGGGYARVLETTHSRNSKKHIDVELLA
jgi:hypothetical protein